MKIPGLIALWMAALALPLPIATQAQGTFPDKPLRIVVPWPPGTPPDVTARVVAAKLPELLKQPVIIENKPGAAGTIGLSEVARAQADGYTLGALHHATATVNTLYPQAKIDLQKDFVPIGQMEWGHNILVVSPSMGVNSVAELIEHVKKNPATYASGGVGSPAHLTGLAFHRATSTQGSHVPYNNFGQAIADVSTGRVSFMVLAAAAAVQQIQGGKLKALAVTGPKRNANLPDVPTVVEAGVPSMQSRTWSGLVVRAGTPPEIIERLAADLAKVMAMPEVREGLARLQAEAPMESLAQHREQVRRDIDDGAKFVRDNGVRAD